MVSAANGDGLDTLVQALADAVPPGPHLYPADDLTDVPDRLLAAEIVREQIFLQTHEEVPYGTTVETESWEERATDRYASRPRSMWHAPARRPS